MNAPFPEEIGLRRQTERGAARRRTPSRPAAPAPRTTCSKAQTGQ
jgi:hypothetical protein